MTTAFTAQEYVDVSTDDGVYVDESGTLGYGVFQFKNKNTDNTSNFVITWNGQTNVAPFIKPVYLQIYNRVSLEWETLSSNNVANANTDFNLTGSKSSSLTNYYDANYWISCRVYQ